MLPSNTQPSVASDATASAVNAGDIAKASKETTEIRANVDAARLEAVRRALAGR